MEGQDFPLDFAGKGLLPAIIQDAASGRVLMLAYMNQDALRLTLETGETHFWSRSRQQLWRKGETSGHRQRVREIDYDCDADALLIQVEQTGVACHTGYPTCFYRRLFSAESVPPVGFGGARPHPTSVYRRLFSAESVSPPSSASILDAVFEVIEQRKAHRKDDSYVCRLMEKGKEAIQKKVIEEAAEVLMSSAQGDIAGVVYETADLCFHTLVLLGYWNISPREVYAELAKRFGKSGIREVRGTFSR